MSFAGVQGREEAATEETLAHHVFSAAHELSRPVKVLPWAEPECDLDLVQEMKNIAVKRVETFAGCPYKIPDLFVVNSRRRSWAASFQTPAR